MRTISERKEQYTDKPEAMPEGEAELSAALRRRRETFLHSMRARSAAATSVDAFEAVGEDAFAYLDRLDGVSGAKERTGEETPAINKGGFQIYIPPVDAGAYADVAGIRGGLFESVQQSARGTLPPPDMRSALRRRTEPPEQPDAPQKTPIKKEAEPEESPAARLLRERIRSERYVSIEEDTLTDRMDKSQFPAFKAALGLSEKQSIIPENDDVPDIMRTRQQLQEAEAAARQPEPEELPGLFDGIGRLYFGGEDAFEAAAEEDGQPETPPEDEEQEVDARQLFDMLERFEQEHEQRVEALETATRLTAQRAYDPYNTVANSRGASPAADRDIPEFETSHGYAIDTEHHAPPPEKPANGSPKRRRKRPGK